MASKKTAAPKKQGFFSRLADKLDPLPAAQKKGGKAVKDLNKKHGGGARRDRYDQILKDAGAKGGRKTKTKKYA